MATDLQRKAELAVQLALDVGADDVFAGVSWGRALEYRWRDDKIEKVQEDQSLSLGIRLWVDGRYSGHSTNDLDPDRMRGWLTEAVALTRHLQQDPHRRITPPELYEGRQDVDLDKVDDSLVQLSPDDRIAWCKAIAESASAHDDVISASSAVFDSHGRSASASSNGFVGQRESTSIWYGGEVTISDGDTKRPEAYRYVGGCHQHGLPTATDTGAEALRRVLGRRGASKAPSQRTAMILHPEAGRGLMGRLLGALGAGSIQQKRSFLAEHLGKSVAASVLTMRDEPFLPRLGGSRLYDGEGIATKRRDIIADGVLQTFFVDTYYGNKLGWEPTIGGPSNVVFEHGEHDLDGLCREAGDGILVESWLGGNANMTTGDFSFGVRGHAIRGGEPAEPISEMNVTGNYATLLQQLAAVGNDPVPWSSFRTPTLVFEDIQFSGA